jgi:hypothetical protein
MLGLLANLVVNQISLIKRDGCQIGVICGLLGIKHKNTLVKSSCKQFNINEYWWYIYVIFIFINLNKYNQLRKYMKDVIIRRRVLDFFGILNLYCIFDVEVGILNLIFWNSMHT